MINNRSNNSNQNGSERKFEIQIESNYDFKADDYGLLSSRIHNILSETTKHISLNDDFVFKISALESSNPNVFISDKSTQMNQSSRCKDIDQHDEQKLKKQIGDGLIN